MNQIYMEVPQGNSLCSYLKQAKMSSLFTFFCKIGELEAGTDLAWEWGSELDTSGGGEEVGKGCKRAIWCKYCVHMN
jgi:hypothetical protein